MNKILLFVCLFLSSFTFLYGQVAITTDGASIDFNDYTGLGFSPTPTPGQLDSDNYAITGMSDGSLAFGGTQISGDFARGTTSGGVGTGGFYSMNDGGNIFLGVQPGGSDFAPGSLTIRYVNNTGSVISSLDVSYNIMTINDQARANSWNFSYSTDDTDYTSVPALDYTSPEAADAMGIVSTARMTSISSLSIPDGGFFYLRWTSEDVSGSGSRDELGIDDIIISNVILPVKFSYFVGNWEENTIQLSWQTQVEQNNAHFDIQRSNNSKTWKTIDKVIGAGTTSEVQDYTYIDKTPIAGINYYRLKQVDYDGAFEYSPIVSVDMEKNETVTVYPNPVMDEVVFEFQTKQQKGTVLSIYSINGQLMQQKTLEEDAAKVEFNLSNLVEGVYFIQIATDKTQVNQRFIKQ